MPVESAADRAGFFNADEFGVEATYAPPGGGSTTACTVLVDRSDRNLEPLQEKPNAGYVRITVNRAELAAPAKGGTFTIGGAAYEVAERPRTADADRQIWIMLAR